MRLFRTNPAFVLALVGIMSLLLVGPIFAQSAVLDMTVIPTSVGWGTITIGGGVAGLSAGILTLTTPVNGAAGYRAPTTLWGATVVDPAGFEIEAEMRVVSASVVGGSVAGIFFRNGIHYCIFEIYTDHIAFYGSWTGTTSYAMDTTDGFHQYILSGSGTHVDVRVDGLLVLSGDNQTSSTIAPHMEFGDGLWANGTTTEWTYFAFGPLGAVATEVSTWGDVKSLYR